MTDNNKAIVTDNATTQRATKALQKVADGLGYSLSWNSCRIILTAQEVKDYAQDSGLPQDIVDDIKAHTIRGAVGLAISDARTKALKYDDERIEVKILNTDKNGTMTIEFLGYDTEGKDSSKKGRRNHLDKVVIDDQGCWLHRGDPSYDFSEKFIKIVEHHKLHLGGNDIYEKITGPMIRQMRSCRIARNMYYVSQTDYNNQLIESLDKFFTKIGYELICLTQAIDIRTRDGISKQVQNTLNKRLEGISDKVSEWKDKNRVHGRSSETVLRELSEILVDTENLESSLDVTLQSLKDTIQKVKDEANGIISTQAPTGILPAVYNDMKNFIADSSKIQKKTSFGNIYLFKVEDFGGYSKGTSLQASANKALANLGYYAFVSEGFVVLRPTKELKAS